MGSHISPPNTGKDQDRALDCQRAMEVAFAQLLSDALAAGWREMEIAIVLADIADDHVLKIAKKT
jgi:hypothetical protein